MRRTTRRILLGSRFDPRKIPGLVAWYDPNDSAFVTLNGPGISRLGDKAWRPGDSNRDLLQATANNQPLISRADNAGNLLVSSEEFQTTWTRTRLNAFGADDSGGAGAGSFANTARTTDPLGGNTSDFIQEDATASNTHAIRSASVALYSGNWSVSCYVKQAGRSWGLLNLFRTGGQSCGGYYNLATGVVGGTTSSGDFVANSLTIEDAGNGWWHCTLNASVASAGVALLEIYCSTGNGVYSYSGDNTSGLFVWGASLRPASWDSTYIATVATPVIAGLNGRRTAYFDGSNDSLKSAAYMLDQPTTVVLCGLKVWTWFINDRLHDGVNDQSGGLYQRTASPDLGIYAGSTSVPALTNLGLGELGFVCSRFSGASSSLTVNTVTSSGNAGTANMGGFTLGARPTGSGPSHIQCGDVLIYNRALEASEISYLRDWSRNRFNLAL